MRNRPLEALVWISGLLLIFGVIILILGGWLLGALMVGAGLVFAIIILIIKAVLNGQQHN